ncbi:MAG TPA: AbrB/MazE/SpoVT family DNA-binding domain-containing protein [Candidatus Hodarchaeales archaeon]|nr:AbrB/MazE/SpoVT family DNA-binding domain-containing protein [Candidatus Hodarchaeales archaeon]HLC85212.1 AbrB/MazE/SpoVT family DNA-binding domain-containing protein [Candidatus Nanoarchaeia archaeon]
MDFEVTKMGERGQVVIPKEFRDHMGLHPGDKFIVVEIGNELVLRKLSGPSKEEFHEMIKKGHEHAKKHGLTEKDMWDAIRKARTP